MGKADVPLPAARTVAETPPADLGPLGAALWCRLAPDADRADRLFLELLCRTADDVADELATIPRVIACSTDDAHPGIR